MFHLLFLKRDGILTRTVSMLITSGTSVPAQLRGKLITTGRECNEMCNQQAGTLKPSFVSRVLFSYTTSLTGSQVPENNKQLLSRYKGGVIQRGMCI